MIWLILTLVILAAVGWARWFAAHSAVDLSHLLIPALSLAISTGSISLVMLWLGLLRLPITFTGTTAVYLLLMLPGWWLSRHQTWRVNGGAWRGGAWHSGAWRTKPLPIYAGVLLAGIAAAVIFNAVQWTFYRDDTLGIYVPFAAEIATTHVLAPITEQRQLYELYPQHISMNYAYVFMASGWQNPYPARLIAALLSLGCLPAVFLLAWHMRGTVTAWAAVFLLALTPDFGNWASSGYVDLPMAFFYTLGALFVWVLFQHGRTVDAVLAGVMFGLAAWTKNAALLSLLILFIIMTYGLMRRQLSLKHCLITCTIIALTASPWYLRNLLLAGRITPDTVWVEDASQSLHELFVLITLPQNYAPSGVVMFGSVFWGLWQMRHAASRGFVAFLFAWSAPYYLTWLLFASYDPRFLLLFLPFLAVLGGGLLAHTWEAVKHRRQPIVVAMMIAVSVLSVVVMWDSVEYKRALLANPLMTHEMKVDLLRE